jgi:FtsH-binding integral membrane protein
LTISVSELFLGVPHRVYGTLDHRLEYLVSSGCVISLFLGKPAEDFHMVNVIAHSSLDVVIGSVFRISRTSSSVYFIAFLWFTSNLLMCLFSVLQHKSQAIALPGSALALLHVVTAVLAIHNEQQA